MTYFINPKFTDRQIQIIKGTILGGSSIIKPAKGTNCYLSMRSKDIEWLSFKAAELQDFASKTPLTIEATNRWHSICYPLFSDIQKEFYKDKTRKINIDCLSSLKDIALAVWFGDCGSIQKDKIILNTHIWGKKGNEIIEEYFDLLGFESKIFKERKGLRIALSEDSSQKFFKIIEPVSPIFLINRLANPSQKSSLIQ